MTKKVFVNQDTKVNLSGLLDSQVLAFTSQPAMKVVFRGFRVVAEQFLGDDAGVIKQIPVIFWIGKA